MSKKEVWTADTKYDLRKTPIRVYLGGEEIQHLTAMNLSNSMGKFSDLVELSFSDTFGQIIRNKKLGDSVTVDYSGQNIFTGKIEHLSGESAGGDTKENKIQLICRANFAEFSLNSVTPKKYKKTTDNAIIEEQLAGGGYTFDLDTAVKIDELDTGTDQAIGKFVESVAGKTNHYLWNEGTKVFKKKVRQTGYSTASLFNTVNDRANVLGVSIKIDASQAHSKIRTYANSQRANNKSTQYKKEIAVNTGILYKGTSYPLPFTRIKSTSVDAKQQNLADLQTEKESAESEPKEVITVGVKGFRFFVLNDFVSLVDDFFGIDGQFVVVERKLELANSGLISTEIELIPKGKKGLP